MITTLIVISIIVAYSIMGILTALLNNFMEGFFDDVDTVDTTGELLMCILTWPAFIVVVIIKTIIRGIDEYSGGIYKILEKCEDLGSTARDKLTKKE